MLDPARCIAHLHPKMIGNAFDCRPRRSPVATKRCVSCQVHDGMALICGNAWAYYISQHGRGRVLVLDLAKEERLRINDDFEIVVMDIEGGRATLGVLCSPCQLPGGR